MSSPILDARPLERPPPHCRKFRSCVVDSTVCHVTARLRSEALSLLFANCFPFTLDQTVLTFVDHPERPDAFIVTGDIEAMWLRDSFQQVLPYIRLVLPQVHQHTRSSSHTDTDAGSAPSRASTPVYGSPEHRLLLLLRGTLIRQLRCVLLDPYANAFLPSPVPPGTGEWDSDLTEMVPGLHERKWELDSLASVLDLITRLAPALSSPIPPQAAPDALPGLAEAVPLILCTLREQQRRNGNPGTYNFRRTTAWGPDAVMEEGYGTIWRACGAVFSTFRPSDDATLFGFNTPQNLYAAEVLLRLSAFCRADGSEPVFGVSRNELLAMADDAKTLSAQIVKAVVEEGVASHGNHGRVFAYEFDGFGNKLFMDDANTPSLLALPLFAPKVLQEIHVNEPGLYSRTRAFVLSHDNPYFFAAESGWPCGIGSPHTLAMPKRIWPLSIISRGMTAESAEEALDCVRMLVATDGGCRIMHESFEADDPNRFTRNSFAWANAAFGSLILHLLDEFPDETTNMTLPGDPGRTVKQ